MSVYFLQANSRQWTESRCMNVSRFLLGATVFRSSSSDRRLNPLEVIVVVGGVGVEGILSSVEVSYVIIISRTF